MLFPVHQGAMLLAPLLQIGVYCAKHATSQFFTVLLLARMIKQEGKGRRAFTSVSSVSPASVA